MCVHCVCMCVCLHVCACVYCVHMCVHLCALCAHVCMSACVSMCVCQQFMNHFYRYLTTCKTSLLALALKSNVSKTKCMPFSGLVVSEFHPFRNMFPIYYKLWKILTFTKEYQLMWSGQDNRGSKGDHLQDLIQRIP